MVDIILCGCNGKMCHAVNSMTDNTKTRIIAGIDKDLNSDFNYPVYTSFEELQDKNGIIIDFSNPDSLDDILNYALKKSCPCVLCTTGYSSVQVEKIKKAADNIPIFYSRNMSLGINLLIELSKTATKILGSDFDIEIIEKHHNQKLDAPSGTALMIADAVSDVRNDNPKYIYDRHSVRKKRESNEIGIHSIRGGAIVGEHDVIFASNDEIITLSHHANSKNVFAKGALNAAIFIAQKPNGLYDMSDLVSDEH